MGNDRFLVFTGESSFQGFCRLWRLFPALAPLAHEGVAIGNIKLEDCARCQPGTRHPLEERATCHSSKLSLPLTNMEERGSALQLYLGGE